MTPRPIPAGEEQQRRVDVGPGRLADDGHPQERGRGREQSREHPDQRRGPGHVDAEQPCAVGVLGADPDGQAGAGEPEEQAEPGERRRRDDQDRQVVAVEDHLSDREAQRVEGRRQLARAQDGAAEQLGQHHAADDQDLPDADRGDGHDEPRPRFEPRHDQPLGQPAQQRAGRQRCHQPDGVRQAALRDEQQAQHRPRAAERGLREVDDPLRAVHQDQAERRQAVEQPEDRALDEVAERDTGGEGQAAEDLPGRAPAEDQFRRQQDERHREDLAQPRGRAPPEGAHVRGTFSGEVGNWPTA
jgi:hypothetical protein